jgi:uncharacterized protein YggE
MKRISTLLNVFLAGILAYVVTASVLPNFNSRAATLTLTPQVAQSACDSSRTIKVTGSAVINVVPDRALIQLGVQSNGVTPDDVQATNGIAMQKVINAVQAMGVEQKDIATDWYIIEPIYDDYTSLYIKGYRINNIIAVTLRDVSKLSILIANTLKAGANQVVNVELYTSELRNHRDQARELAMKAAEEKARDLATTAGAETGCVLYIEENSWSYYNGWWYGQNSRNLWNQNAVQNADPSGSTGFSGDAEPVSLGQISVRAEVSATFSLK